jgi:monoamine oxidase
MASPLELAHQILPTPFDPRGRSADVAVVGAGLAGLVAAARIKAAGHSVVVLEARPDRVGGRLESALHDGHAVDLGGAWIGAHDARAAALARDLGVPTWPTHSTGEPVVIAAGGRRMRGRGYKLRHLLSTLDGRRAARHLDRLALTVDAQSPWAAADADDLDGHTLESWLARTARLSRSRATLGGTLTNLLGIEPRAVSLLHALFYLRSSGGMQAMLGDHDGAQQTLIHGGAQSLAQRLADRLHGSIELGAPVRTIEHGDGSGGVRLISDALTVDAGAAVVALSPVLAGRIAYEPKLPVDRDRLTAAMAHGDVTKVVAVYGSAFWRDEGLSGEAWGDELPFSFSYDMSPPDGQPGVLTLFFVGDRSRRLREGKADVRSALAQCFGPRAGQPQALLARDWAAEEWTRGAYCGYMPPGAWTRYGWALREPAGPLAWAGSETAVTHAGYMEGAIESGERAAADALRAIGSAARTPGSSVRLV